MSRLCEPRHPESAPPAFFSVEKSPLSHWAVGTVVVKRLALRWTVDCSERKKNVLSFTMAPPIDPEIWLNASGMSTGLIDVSVEGVTQLETEGAQKLFVEKLDACMSPGRSR